MEKQRKKQCKYLRRGSYVSGKECDGTLQRGFRKTEAGRKNIKKSTADGAVEINQGGTAG